MEKVKLETESVSGNIKLINCSIKYWDFIRKLRNKNIGFVQQVKITHYQQILYMKNHNKDYKVCILNNIPVGFIGEVDFDLRLAVHERYQNKGVAKYMLKNFKTKKHTIGKVKKDNIHSKSLFISCGWKLSDKIGDNYYYYENGK